MPWTQFWDMASGGRRKLDWGMIFIEGDLEDATRVFEETFGRDPSHVTCTCCGPDYSSSEYDSLEAATAHHRGCVWVERRDADRAMLDGRYIDGDGKGSGEPIPDGFIPRAGGYGRYCTLDEFVTWPEVKVIPRVGERVFSDKFGFLAGLS